jgi:hypothetical protein
VDAPTCLVTSTHLDSCKSQYVVLKLEIVLNVGLIGGGVRKLKHGVLENEVVQPGVVRWVIMSHVTLCHVAVHRGVGRYVADNGAAINHTAEVVESVGPKVMIAAWMVHGRNRVVSLWSEIWLRARWVR